MVSFENLKMPALLKLERNLGEVGNRDKRNDHHTSLAKERLIKRE